MAQVVYFLNSASGTSIPLEIASRLDKQTPELDVSIVSWGEIEPNNYSSDLTVQSLAANSQLDPHSYRQLFRYFLNEQPDILHVHPNATGSVARVLAKAAGVPHVVSTEHNPHTFFGPLKNLVNGSTNWLSDIVIANSEKTHDSFSRWEEFLLSMANAEKLTIYNGVDIDSIRAAESENISLPDGFTIGSAGRLVQQKNLRTLFHAAVPLIKETHDVNLVFVGKGPEQDSLEQLAKDLRIDESVHFIGYYPNRRDVYGFFKKLDVFVFPSHYEGFGVAAAEAMAAGTPVIANDLPVLREVIGEAGIFVDVSDSSKFTSAMMELYQDKTKRDRLGESGIKRIERQFPLEKTVQEHIELYNGIIDNI